MRKDAFTLAEVLITLGIIGIVAAMTMPTLIQKNNEKATITKLKKFMSVMNSAITMSTLENGPIESWPLTNSIHDDDIEGNPPETLEGLDFFVKTYILPYLKYTKFCGFTESNCFAYERHSLDGTRFGDYSEHLVLADGSVIVHFWVTSNGCTANHGDNKQLSNVCGEVALDVNGRKLPNKSGEDVFYFDITKYGVYPKGSSMEKWYSFEKMCNLSTKDRLNGYGCTAWIIYNENMDYLHCNDLSWNGKKKCR